MSIPLLTTVSESFHLRAALRIKKVTEPEMHTGWGLGEGVRSEKLSYKNAIKHEKGGPLDFLKTPSIPLKEFTQNP